MSEAQPSKREIPWANSAVADNIEEPSDGQKASGWTGTPAPPYQWFNWILRQSAKWIEYLRGRGIPDYAAAETYRLDDVVQYSHRIYRRIDSSSTSGIDPSDGRYWIPCDSTCDLDVPTITAGRGSVANITVLKLGTAKIVSFALSGVTIGTNQDVQITLSSSAAFDTAIRNVQVTCFYGASGFSPSATYRIISANVVELTFAVGGDSYGNASVTLIGT
jgi:hypothetical protein